MSPLVNRIFLGFQAGAIVGVLVGGIGGRLAMRIIALGQHRPLMLSLRGTLTVIFVATLFRIGAGMIYAAVRPYVPGKGIGRALLFGLALQVLGYTVGFPLPLVPAGGTVVRGDVVARVVLAVLFFLACVALEMTLAAIESRRSRDTILLLIP